MDTKIIAGIFIGLFLVASIATIGIIKASDEKENPEISECTECGNACTLESNCGLQTCGAVSGGSCGCGR